MQGKRCSSNEIKRKNKSYIKKNSISHTVTQEPIATVSNPLLKYASTKATIMPIIADKRLSVE